MVGIWFTVTDYKIQKVTAHTRYNTEDKFNDIGLIRVDRDIDFSTEWVRPICLPFKKEYNIENLFPSNLNGRKGVVAGWGRTYETFITIIFYYGLD